MRSLALAGIEEDMCAAFLEGNHQNKSGQILTTSAEVTPNGGLVGESLQNDLNSGLGILVICPEY